MTIHWNHPAIYALRLRQALQPQRKGGSSDIVLGLSFSPSLEPGEVLRAIGGPLHLLSLCYDHLHRHCRIWHEEIRVMASAIESMLPCMGHRLDTGYPLVGCFITSISSLKCLKHVVANNGFWKYSRASPLNFKSPIKPVGLAQRKALKQLFF